MWRVVLLLSELAARVGHSACPDLEYDVFLRLCSQATSLFIDNILFQCVLADGPISGNFTAEDIFISGQQLQLKKVQGRTVTLTTDAAIALSALYCDNGWLQAGD